METESPLTPAAADLLRDITLELNRPAAALAPAGLRQAVAQLGRVVLAMAQRIDHLQTGKGATT